MIVLALVVAVVAEIAGDAALASWARGAMPVWPGVAGYAVAAVAFGVLLRCGGGDLVWAWVVFTGASAVAVVLLGTILGSAVGWREAVAVVMVTAATVLVEHGR